MGYVAVKGGTVAIEESIKKLKYERLKGKKILNVEDIRGGMRGLIDQVMSESSLYSEELAAIAIKQTEGNSEEAVFVLRAYRSTLPRKHYTKIVDTDNMAVERRISASFKDIVGGQILGASYDYTHRLMDFDLANETIEDALNWVREYEKQDIEKEGNTNLGKLPKVVDYLRKEGLMKNCEEDNSDPLDITKRSLEFPSSRSERLQILTRGQTGAVTSLGYAALRAYGATHPTVGELRVGKLHLYIDNPLSSSDDEEEDFYIGDICVTEVESLIPNIIEKKLGEKELEFVIGYGICYGQNETKAIAMSILDHCLEIPDDRYPTSNEEFVLYHIDCVESTGFISHLKLPHYVTFQSKLDSVRKTRKGKILMKINYNFAFFDEGSKKEIRRASLKAVAIPGYQVPFPSREMPIARGWGTGGLQLTLSLIGREDILKVIDQGSDESVNAVNIKKLISKTTGVKLTDETSAATLIQSRHRIPEIPLEEGQILVLQVPTPEPLRIVEPSEFVTKRLHSEMEYSGAWLMLFEKIMKFGDMATGADHPVLVHDRYVMAPSPIPRFDNPKLNNSKALILFGAGREKKVYAIPPFTNVESLAFEDFPFQIEDFPNKTCRICGASGVYLDEIINEDNGATSYQCSDTSFCTNKVNKGGEA